MSSMTIPDRPGFAYRLRDGSELFLAPVLPEDAWRLRDGLERMSPQSRYLRFFEGMTEISPAQVRYFTRVDQVDHVAWGALDMSGYPWPGLGIGRFARLDDRPATAEWALAIIDEYQSRGLGTALLAILYLEAESRQIRTLTALVLPENRFVLRWLGNLGASIERQPDAFEINLPVNRANLQASPTGQRLAALIDELEPHVRNTRNAPVGAL